MIAISIPALSTVFFLSSVGIFTLFAVDTMYSAWQRHRLNRISWGGDIKASKTPFGSWFLGCKRK